jgi:hypothetical protein
LSSLGWIGIGSDQEAQSLHIGAKEMLAFASDDGRVANCPSAPHRKLGASGLRMSDRSPMGAKLGQHIDIRMLDMTEIELLRHGLGSIG